MLFSPRVNFLVKLGLVFISLFLTGHYLFVRNEVGKNGYHEIYQTAISGKKAVFVQNVMRNPIDGPFDNRTLVELCKSKTWTPGLIFRCDSPKGGVGNVRNVFLNCVRYAIEAGATSFIVPEIIGYGTTLTTVRKEMPLPFDHFFDLEHFTQSLGWACPQIKFINHFNDLWNVPSTAKAVLLQPEGLLGEYVIGKVLAHPEKWASALKHHLNASHPKPFSAELPGLVTLQQPMLQFPLSYDDPHFVSNFGKILRFREDVRRIAATVQWAMSKKFDMGMKAREDGVFPGRYYGAHLRTAPDAKAAGWTPYETQAKNYLDHASQWHIPVIYLAGSEKKDLQTFRLAAGNFSLAVTTKEELLAEKGYANELKELDTLQWDQRILVDYEMLLKSSIFGGTHESTFSWNVAMRRHVVVGRGNWTAVGGEGATGRKRQPALESLERFISGRQIPSTAPGNEAPAPPEFNSPQSFKDRLSVVFGPPAEGRIFQLSMWP
ncbi:hypothetical protein BGZ60DRAFT_372421 [Tricladium varicosporioides]|nr:hypothetical protein BGZ60DRAFT_372421 [Hymenoscyphus varicosporioides]